MPDEKEELTSLEQEAKQIGEQLVYMLTAADLPDDVKSAWLSLVPHMDLAQIDQLMKALARYTAPAANEAFGEVATKIEEIQGAHAEQVSAAADKANSAMDEIEKMIEAN